MSRADRRQLPSLFTYEYGLHEESCRASPYHHAPRRSTSDDGRRTRTLWVPRLRRLVKQIRSNCHGCVRFRAQSYHRPPPGRLPPTRTQGTTPFQVLGVDFAGPIRYKTTAGAERKSYLVLYACSLMRAVHLELLRSLEVVEFLPSLKRLIARRGRPQVIYSDNATTFKAAEKWLKQAQRDERFNALLADKGIQ